MLDAVVAIRECSTSTRREAFVAKLMRSYTKKIRKSSALTRLKQFDQERTHQYLYIVVWPISILHSTKRKKQKANVMAA